MPSVLQTPGGDIAKNLASFLNLHVLSGEGTDPGEAARLIRQSVRHVREGQGPATPAPTASEIERQKKPQKG